MKTTTKVKQIVTRFDQPSYDSVKKYAKIEHRGIGDFVRHAALDHIEKIKKEKEEIKKSEEKSHETKI